MQSLPKMMPGVKKEEIDLERDYIRKSIAYDYYGLINVSKVADTTIKNSSIYFYVKVPIGTWEHKSEK